MKKCILAITALTILIITGCQNQPDQPSDSNFLMGLTKLLYNLDDTTNISALIIVRGGILYANRVVTYNKDYVMTYFSDGYDLVNISSISANNINLNAIDDCEDCPGQYGGGGPYPTEYPPHMIFNVSGYLGHNFIDTFQTVQKIIPLNFLAGDTVSKSTGIVINYSGADQGTLYISIFNDEIKTTDWISPDSVHNISQIDFQTLDNGSLFLSPAFLSELPTGQYYGIGINHQNYSTKLLFDNINVGRFSIYSISTFFYLGQ